VTTEWRRKGGAAKEPLRYPDCGLDDVYLVGGYEFDADGNLVVQGIDELYEAIGKWVAQQPRPLTPSEIRFLRKRIGLSQSQLGLCLGCDPQTVARWEKGQSSNGPADRMLRTIFLLKHSSEAKKEIEEMLRRIVDLHEQLQGAVKFVRKNRDWSVEAA
jgi:putative transcriptional regulator